MLCVPSFSLCADAGANPAVWDCEVADTAGLTEVCGWCGCLLLFVAGSEEGLLKEQVGGGAGVCVHVCFR